MEENGMSTQVFGPYHKLMEFLQGSIYSSMQKEKNCVFVMKIVSGDRKEHDPDY